MIPLAHTTVILAASVRAAVRRCANHKATGMDLSNNSFVLLILKIYSPLC